LVFRPEATRVLCSYPKDGSTQSDRVCNPPGVSDHCLPGCSYHGRLTWCSNGGEKNCAWPPAQLADMLSAQEAMHNSGPTDRYNEVIVDAEFFSSHLPDAVEAIFFIGFDSSEHCESENHWANVRGNGRKNHCENYARLAHQHFLDRFQLNSDDVPLLRLDAFASDTPFSLSDAPSTTTITATGETIELVCLTDLRASSVYISNGFRPQLWVYEGQGNFATLKKTRPAESSREPQWSDTICISLLPRRDGRVCFDIRAADTPPSDPQLLHFGCTTVITANSVDMSLTVVLNAFSIKNKPHAAVHFSVRRASPPSPPSPPTPPFSQLSPSPCTSAWCSIFDSWLDDPNSKFMRLWGASGWILRARGQRSCWDDLGGARFFDDALAGTKCNRNWMEGAYGSEGDRPNFDAPAPALLGFDSTIWEYCSRHVGIYHFDGFSHTELAARCIRSHNNILRMVSGEWGWNMCQNLVWQLCAVQGRLPGQAGRLLHFATAPKELQLHEWEHPTSWPCENGRCPTGKYSVGDVFFAEIAVFRWICRNTATLFQVDSGVMMECDMDMSAFHHLKDRLLMVT